MHALVGANNSGKSTVLRALDYLFNPSTRTLTNESFWNSDTNLEIRIEALFTGLTQIENEVLGPYLRPEGTFHMARTAVVSNGDSSQTGSEGTGYKQGHHYRVPVPDSPWLRDSEINGANITEWWRNKDELIVGGMGFGDFLDSSTKPSVGDWKAKASEFVEANQEMIPCTETWVDNPRGYANVLKNTLPFFVLIPAVRDVVDESKVTKSSPFGQLLFAILESVEDSKKAEIESTLRNVAKRMNRVGGSERVPSISETEHDLNTYLREIFNDSDIEIEFETPTLEVLLSSPKIYVNDGFRNIVENKGHGLQRAVIFSIIRRYADLMTRENQRTLILAIEEPELYMHPQAQRTIRKVLRRIAEGNDQIIYSTHSAFFVDVAYFDEIIRLESKREDEDGINTTVSSAWQMPMTPMIDDLIARYPVASSTVTGESIRERYAHAYSPNRNEGFFASRVIIVEGATEEYSLPVYADAMGIDFDSLGVSVIECGGKNSIDRLYRVFNELGLPCYVIFDYDYGNSDNSIIQTSKDLLTFLSLETGVPAGVQVTEKTTYFRTTWEKELSNEIVDLDLMTAAARNELGLKSGSGKPLIARHVARSLISGNPAFVPPSVKAAIEAAMAVEWSGTCLESPTESADE